MRYVKYKTRIDAEEVLQEVIMGEGNTTTGRSKAADRMASWFIYGAVFGAALTMLIVALSSKSILVKPTNASTPSQLQQKIKLSEQALFGIDDEKVAIHENDSGIFYFHLLGCPHCEKALPILRRRAATKEVTIVVSARGDKKEEAFREVKSLAGPVPTSWRVLFDPDGKVSASWGIEGYPTLALIRGGETVLIQTGINNGGQYAEFIDRVLRTRSSPN